MKRSAVPYVLVSCIVVSLCCAALIVMISAGIIVLNIDNPFNDLDEISEIKFPTPIATEIEELPEASSTEMVEEGSSSTGNVDRPAERPLPAPVNTLEILENTYVPLSDWVELAERLGGIDDIPVVYTADHSEYDIGTMERFWVLDTDDDESFQVDTTLRYKTDHAYYWIENGVQYNDKELERLAETFERQIYPTDRAYFGSEWSPGVDGDPHLYIVYARGLGENLAGYFSSSDEYHPLVQEHSNMHETFMLNADNSELDDEYTFGVLAHEFQHMIHWYQDRNETAWLNEGSSELAVFINGYDTGGFDIMHAESPDLQLNDWPNDQEQTTQHYGASFLFMVYFLDRFGPDVTKTLIQHPDNGLVSIDAVLESLDEKNPVTGEGVSADDIFLDWTLANYLMNKNILDGRFTYHNYSNAPQTGDTEIYKNCPTDLEVRDVNQYGVDYVRFRCKGDYTLHFEGAGHVEVIPEYPHSGKYGFWSNKGDDSDMLLTKTFDFRDHTGPLSLSYWTWYDIEEDWDYVYLEISLDGKTWEIIKTPSGTEEDPIGNSYGWGYTGLSGSDGVWVQEVVDLSAYAGEEVYIRFEYVTDGAVNGEGFLIDDIAIPEIGYATDFEMDDDGWEAEGFVRIDNVIPQTFRLAMIESGRNPQVTYLNLEPGNTLDIPVSIGGDVDDVVLVVTGTTRFTRQKAIYQFQMIED